MSPELYPEGAEFLIDSEIKVPVSEIAIGGENYKLLYMIDLREMAIARLSLMPAILPDYPLDPVTLNMGGLRLEEDELSAGIVLFTSGDHNKIVAPIVLGTRRGYEGKGLGTTVGCLAHAAIKDVRESFPEWLGGRQIIAEITGTAHAQSDTRRRDGWSSSLAIQLGFERVEDINGAPNYRKSF